MSLAPGTPGKRGPRHLLVVGTGAAATALALATAPAAGASPESAATPEGGPTAGPVAQQMAQDLDIGHREATRRIRAQDDRNALADRLRRELGNTSAGAFIDADSGKLVVNVTTQKAARRVAGTAARSQVVDHSMQRLTEIKNSLQWNAVTGTTLGIDVAANAVEVTIPGGAEKERTERLRRQARSFGDAVKISHVAGAPRTTALYGGEALYGGGSRCSAAFVASSGGTEYVITAGHCTDAVSSWSVSEGHLGPSVRSSFPGNDYGLIRKDGPVNAVGQVINGSSAYEISSAGNPPAGTYVCKSGSTTDTTCGYIERYNVTVNYPSGTVRDLIQTDVCTGSGDSGGAPCTRAATRPSASSPAARRRAAPAPASSRSSRTSRRRSTPTA